MQIISMHISPPPPTDNFVRGKLASSQAPRDATMFVKPHVMRRQRVNVHQLYTR